MVTQEEVDIVERIKACVVAGKDPKPLQEELARLLSQGHKNGNAKSRPVPTDPGRPRRKATPGPQDRGD